MSNLLSAVQDKMRNWKQNGKAKFILIASLALLLIVTITLAWYINNVGLWGMEFHTGNIEFNTYVYDKDGVRMVGPVSSAEEDQTGYMNAPLIPLQNAKVDTIATAYIVVESTGSIGIQYRIAFDITGRTENSTAYLGGYKYNVTKVTDTVDFSGGDTMDVSRAPVPSITSIKDEVVTIDRNAVHGSIEDKNHFEVYRVDFTLSEHAEEYTGGGINIYFNIFATQLGGDFDNDEERGYTYYCSTKEDIDRAKVEAYPGDIIKLSSDIVYYGDLVFNKPVHLETNDFVLTVNGNLMYDYVLSNTLRIDAGGLGQIVVRCTKEGVGGNFQIKAPIGDVILIGSNASGGDFVVEKNMIVDATNAFGSAGVSFNEVKIIDMRNARKTILLESNTRATVSFDTTIEAIHSVAKANNIEIVNNGDIGEIDLSAMDLLDQTNSPQIYILNNNDIEQPIMLPRWSVKFVENADGTCSGNTRIIQSYSGNEMYIFGNCNFEKDDIEVERKEYLVEQIEEGNDSRLKIYYQDLGNQSTSIESILRDYIDNLATTGCKLNEIIHLEIVSVGDKAVTKDDIVFMNSNDMMSLQYLDLKRANVYGDGKSNKLPESSFEGVSKYETLILPQNLTEIGVAAFKSSAIDNVITIPSGVETFGAEWFSGAKYVHFAASVPVAKAADGLSNVKAIFVEEAYIGSYKSVYSAYATRIYPTSQLDETKQHFVRNIKANEWEITYYVWGEDAAIGNNITIDGTKLNIVSVYDNAYRHNYSGASVSFADTVTKLGAGNFAGNKSIKKADLNRIQILGDSAFYGAERLAEVDFGDDLETIGASAFANCVSLNQDLSLPESLENIGREAFRKSSIRSVITGGAKTVESKAFEDCSYLNWAELPEVQVIGNEGQNNLLFSDCDSLVSVRLPALLNAYGKQMFEYCVSLREIHMASDDDGVNLGADKDVFVGCTTNRLKMFVPEKLVSFYREKCPGGISASMIYPEGEKLGELLVEGYNIGEYIVSDNGDNTYTLSTSNLDYVDSLVIPETFEEMPITRIYSGAFRNQSLTNVTLTLGTKLRYIDDSAFANCKGLRKVEFESATSLRVIGASAFSGCDNLVQDVIFPGSMESVGANAFYKTGILSLNTGGMVSLESHAFSSCTSLVYVIMPEVTTVAESGTNYVFDACSSLVSVDMPKVAKVYGEGMFRNCKSLLELYMAHGDSDVSLGTKTFTSAYSKQVKLFVPEELLSIYKNKAPITSTQIFPRGEKMGEKTVNGFYVGDYVVMDKGDYYVLVTTHLNYTGDVSIPGEFKGKPITEIYSYAFHNQTFTNANVYFHENIAIIGSNAFYKASGIMSAVMDGVTTVGSSAFSGSGIEVLIGPRMTSVGSYAFSNCTNLESVSIPQVQLLTSGYEFYECTSLKYVYFENLKQIHFRSFLKTPKLEKIIINRIITDTSEIPTSLNNMGLVLESELCQIYVPYRCLEIYGEKWFGKPVVSYDLVATYDMDTYILAINNDGYTLTDFYTMDGRPHVVIPNVISVPDLGEVSIYSIRSGAFSSVYTVLRDLTLPSTVSYLSSDAFSECTSLENFFVDEGNAHFTSIEGVLYSKDQRILLKYPVNRNATFDMADPAYSTTACIASGAFLNANMLSHIIFPEELAVIDSNAFTGCTALKTVEFTGATPPVLMGSGIFNASVSGFKMIVPADVEEAYRSAYNFTEYVSYMETK